ncbi:MAG: glycosyltransferase family 2 protein [Pirellula sp.]
MSCPRIPISIITPTWNGLPYIQECVESVLSQCHREFELLISDDVSSDETRKYLQTINDPRVRVFYQESNLGIFGNLNFLFTQATYPISYILCQDDALRPGGLSHVVRTWSEQAADVAWIRFNFWDVTTQACSLTRFQQSALPRCIEPENADLYFFVFGNILGNLSNNSIRTPLVSQAGYFNQSFPYAGDFEFWIRLAKLGKLVILDDHVVNVRSHPRQASFLLNRKGELIPQLYSIVDNLYSRLKTQYSPSLLRKHAARYYDSPHLKIGFQQLVMAGRREYLMQIGRASHDVSCFPNAWNRFLECVLTLGGRCNKLWTGQRLLAGDAKVEK